ncbi:MULTISPECIES: hypothetical protein [Sphingobacterium]|uniref:hypothetical protein n=1 Tax=Sphingobacterium TaxID=28453 RepID=UPI00257A6581|nr:MULTISPECIES: hypothetical protein [Sphingobacterium]
MKKFATFECEVDGRKQDVMVSVLHGGGSIQVLINKLFIMSISYRGDQWVMLCNNDSWLTTDELTIFLEELGWEE